MQVINRQGEKEPLKFDKITARISKLCYGLDERIDPVKVVQSITIGFYDDIKTSEIDQLAAETAASFTTIHPDFSTLAARIAISNLHKYTHKSFFETMKELHENKDEDGEPFPIISDRLYELADKYKKRIAEEIVYDRDFDLDFFGFKVMEKSVLLKLGNRTVERPQHTWMRVSLAIHEDDIDMVIKTYHMFSKKQISHAAPTLYNAGTRKQQLSSCFLLDVEDSIDGIYKTLTNCAKISKLAGGIGFNVSSIRSKGSRIKGTNGKSDGIIPMLKVFNETARYVDQAGRRKGAFAVYIEPWHADIFDFLELRKNHGKEEMRTRDLFTALWIPDLFMKRVKEGGIWSLMCPNECKGLSDVYGEEFETLYCKYESEGKFRKQVQAQELWFRILDAQIETGTPYIAYKDACNIKSNHKNLGTIKNSNLCIEILEYQSSKSGEVAVCNLASIPLIAFVKDGKFDFNELKDTAYHITINLNKIIDINYYPLPETKYSNLKHRPIGIGVQALADVFMCMGLPFDSDEAKDLNKRIFETIYFGTLSASNDLAIKDGAYESFIGSPFSKGILQFDMWGVIPTKRWDWETLRQSIVTHGIRNSLLTALMPTATTASMQGNNDCFEPKTSNIYSRRVLSGEFVVLCKWLVKDLMKIGLWNENIKDQIIAANGSIQGINSIPDNIKLLHRTVWELKMKDIIDMAADRAPYIDQTQSMNLFMANANHSKLTSMHFYAWEKGLKTGMYYLRTKSAVDAIKFTIDVEKMKQISCSINNPEDCEMCSA